MWGEILSDARAVTRRRCLCFWFLALVLDTMVDTPESFYSHLFGAASTFASASMLLFSFYE